MRITLHDKTLDIRLTAAAEKALARRDRPLVVEMELLFSCLLRKRVLFDGTADGAVAAGDGLAIRFRPIMTRRCDVSDTEGAPPSEDFPIANPRPYVPNWLALDYRRGAWVGEFGYAD